MILALFIVTVYLHYCTPLFLTSTSPISTATATTATTTFKAAISSPRNISFPRLRDDPFPELYGTSNKAVLLKAKLLDNLNNYFEAPPADRLEILRPAEDVQKEEESESWQSNSIIGQQEQKQQAPFPTLLTTAFPIPTEKPLETIARRRSETRITNADELRNIREWRKRLYRAFKSNSRSRPATIVRYIGEGTPIETKQIPNGNPIVEPPEGSSRHGEGRISRKEPHWQSMLAAKQIKTFKRDGSGNMIPIIGTEKSGYSYSTDSQAIEPYPSISNKVPYRTTNDRQPVVFIPGPENQPRSSSYRTYPVMPPATAYLVTATASPPSPLQTLPPLVTPSPSYTQAPLSTLQEYGAGNPLSYHSFPSYPSAPQPPFIASPNNNYAAPNYAPPPDSGPTPPSKYKTFPSYQSSPNGPTMHLITPPAPPVWTDIPTNVEDADLQDNAADDGCVRAPSCIENVVTDEKCNSIRLKMIIQNNIIPGDAESSKRAVQAAAEAETGIYFDCVCGTGFFSYIAHTDEFCLSAAGGVNCYLFSPICSNSNQLTELNGIFGKSRKTRRKVFLNKN